MPEIAIPIPFEFAARAIEQTLLLCTGLLTFTLAFAKEFKRGDSPSRWLQAAWLVSLVSIATGALALNSLAGLLAMEISSPIDYTPDIYAQPVKVIAIVHTFTFLVAVLFSIIAAMRRQ